MLHHVVQAPAVLVGNSLGGTVAAHVARDYPHLVRGIVLVDAIGMPGVVAALPPGKQLFFRAAQSPLGSVMMRLLDGPAGVRQFLHALYHRRERITPELVATLSGPFRRPNTAPFCLSVLRSLERITLDMRPGDVTTPTLIVWGEKDPALSPLMACALQQYIFPHASLHLIPRSGHCPFDETPEAFCDIVIPWIASLTKPDNPH
jgi:pimeloyl-ACP methyl ester carboxylesterase